MSRVIRLRPETIERMKSHMLHPKEKPNDIISRAVDALERKLSSQPKRDKEAAPPEER